MHTLLLATIGQRRISEIMATLRYLVLLICIAELTLAQDPQPNVTIIREPGRCIWFGECEQSPYGADTMYNCYYNGKSKKISDLGIDFMILLKATCPQLYDRGEVCCDLAQLTELATQIKYPRQLFSRCPACQRNFIDHFCDINCHPDQSLFMDPTGHLQFSIKKDIVITNITVYVPQKYAIDLFDSCKDVQYPELELDTKVVDIMCGGADRCNSSLWLSYLGDPSQNPNSPFPMAYSYNISAPKGIIPHNHDFIACNTADTNYRCNCSDCAQPDVCSYASLRLIIKSVGIPYTVFEPSGVYGVSDWIWTFGPILARTVLTEIFYLQSNLTHMKVPYTDDSGTVQYITLDDICYKPNAPQNTNCSILSVLNYFQNDLDNILYTEDFGLVNSSYHIHYCTRVPTASQGLYYTERSMSCLGSFGGPIYPQLVLDGYNANPFCAKSKTKYENSTTQMITFTLDGKSAPVKMIETWYEAFKIYTSKFTGVHITVDYLCNDLYWGQDF